ncbi:hypothetical protein [Streptomyces sp. LKA04]|uniref:hypothetical protein n=1 Tax=Streptomyces sp. LKA04 TaxID=3398092 RepID=UPI003A801F2A
MTERLTPQRETEIRDYIATCTNWSLDALAARDLLAELAAVRAERDQARADSERSRAAHFHKAARLLEDAGHDDDAVNLLDTLADGIHAEAEDASDNRRRLYVDGKGNGWISVCHDEGTEWIVPVQPEVAVEQDVRDVADETCSLREIGRCW